MSRLIISNAHIPSIKDESRKIVYKVADTNIFAYNKLNINNINHYSKSTDWIVGVGSYIYKHSTGGEALEKILQDFTEESIHVLKQQIKGIYTLAIYKNGVICCFNDYYGLYDTYYGNNDDFYYISTNIADILPFFKTIEINEYPFMLHCFGNGNFSSDGILKGSLKLMGNEYIKIVDGTIIKFSLKDEDYHVHVPSFESVTQALSYLTEQIDNIVEDIKNCFGMATLSVTGGLDSRLVMGGLTHKTNSIKKLIYGESKSFHLYTCPEDKEVANELSSITGVPLEVYDWTNPESTDNMNLEWQRKLFSQVGFYNDVYCGNERYVDTICNRSNGPYMEFGYFLEAIRMREWLEKKNDNVFSIDEYFDINYSSIQNLPYMNKDGLIKWMKELFMNKTRHLNIKDYNSIPISLASEIEWSFRERITDSAVHKFINNYMYAFPIFSVPQIHEFVIKLPTDIIKKAKFQIQFIKALNPELLKAGVFSHRRKYRINRKGEKVLVFDVKNILTVAGSHMPWVYKSLLPIYQSFVHHSSVDTNKVYLEQIEEIKGSYINFINLSEFNGDVSRLFTLRQALLAFKFAKSMS